MSITYKNIIKAFIFIFLFLLTNTIIEAKPLGYNLESQKHSFERCTNLNSLNYADGLTILKPGNFLYIGTTLTQSADIYDIYFKYIEIITPYSPLQTPSSEPFNVKFRYCTIEHNNPEAQMQCAPPTSPLYNIYLTEDFAGNYPEYSYNIDSYWTPGNSMLLGFCGVSGDTLFVKNIGFFWNGNIKKSRKIFD